MSTQQEAINELANFVQSNEEVLTKLIPNSLNDEHLRIYQELVGRLFSVANSGQKQEQPKSDKTRWVGTLCFKHRGFKYFKSENLGEMVDDDYSKVVVRYNEMAVAQLTLLYGDKFDKDVEKWEVRVRPFS